jgi:anti-sigma-K factor RskA
MTHDLHTLTGAYALDALDDDERRRFEEHLQTCEVCAQEVRGLVATAGRLGAHAERRPPESLHAGVMAQVRATRQVAPLPAEPGADGMLLSLKRARSRSRVLMAVAAALLVVAGSLGAVAVSQQHRATRAEQATGQLARVLGAPDARTLTAAAGSGSSARVVFSLTEGRAVFVPHDMSAARGRDLQLWVIQGSTFRSVGLVKADRPLVAAGVDAGSVLGVTVEPAGGSPQPTSAPVLQVRLA